MVLFFLTKQGEFASTLNQLRIRQHALAPGDVEAMHSIGDRYAEAPHCYRRSDAHMYAHA